MAPKIVVITGPTATGKTRMGVEIAKIFGGEVVSADSMQIYRDMNIGTAKPTAEETAGVPHHMIDAADPREEYSVSRFVEEASAVTDGIIARGKLPIIVGGTGLYIQSLVQVDEFAPRGENKAVREKYEALYDEKGGEEMLRLLSGYDPARAAKLHPNDKRRVVRALEVAETSEANLTAHDEGTKGLPPRYDAAYIVLGFENRAALYRRIDKRVDDMMAAGLADEVRRLLDSGVPPTSTAMQAIGYKEIAAALRGECSMEAAADTVKQSSRRYAKRQISWCQRYENALRVNWGDDPNFDDGLRISTEFLRQSGII